MKKLFTTSLVLIFGLVLAACQVIPSSSDENMTTNEGTASETENAGQTMEDSTSPASDSANTGEATNVISLETIAEHATADDCWMAIEGKVYDVTPFVESQKHPGGAAILEGCGQDATTLFNERPGEGDAHSQQARSLLPQYLIGDLAN